MAITIVRDDVARVFCALFHDRDDGVGFGRLVAGEILSAFIEARLAPTRGRRAHAKANHPPRRWGRARAGVAESAER